MAERRRMSCEESLRLPPSSESASRSTGGSTEVTTCARFWVPRRLRSHVQWNGFLSRAADRHCPACGGGGAMEGGKGEGEVPEGVVVGKVRAFVAEVGNQPIERAVGKAAYALGGDDVDIDGVGAEGEGGGVPDGIEDDVVDGVEWTVAVPTDKEAAR